MSAAEVINIEKVKAKFAENGSPEVIPEFNRSHVKLAEFNKGHMKLVKFEGEYIWHKHDDEDELFFVLSGIFKIALRDRELEVHPGELLVLPRGVEHRPIPDSEVVALLVEPGGITKTGDKE